MMQTVAVRSSSVDLPSRLLSQILQLSCEIVAKKLIKCHKNQSNKQSGKEAFLRKPAQAGNTL